MMGGSACNSSTSDATRLSNTPSAPTFSLARTALNLLQITRFMSAIGRFQKSDSIFYAKVVDGEIYPLRGDVFGSRVRNVTPAAAARHILGYTAAQDISDRTIQNGESQWTRSKSFDTFTPLGPYVETKIDPHDLTIQLFQNGQLRQNSNTSQLIFNCYQLVSFISTNMTLMPGDVIVTGTPSGVGPIESGDRLEVRIQGLAPLVNTVK